MNNISGWAFIHKNPGSLLYGLIRNRIQRPRIYVGQIIENLRKQEVESVNGYKTDFKIVHDFKSKKGIIGFSSEHFGNYEKVIMGLRVSMLVGMDAVHWGR